MEDKRIELKGEEILKILTPLRKRWTVFKTIGVIIRVLIDLSFIAGFVGLFLNMRSVARFIQYFIVFFVVEFIFISLGNIWQKFCKKVKLEYADNYKRLISRPVLDSCFDNARFDPGAGFPRAEFQASGLMQIASSYTYESEDLITGTYKGVAFRRADIGITHQTGGKNKTTVVDADGRLLEIAFPKGTHDMIRIVKDLKAITIFGGEDVIIKTEDMDFNRKFCVYAKDRHSAFYVLTPQVIEYFKRLYDREDDIYITFNGKKLYILLSGHGGIFEPPFRKFDIWDEVRKCKGELTEIREIIEGLQLDVPAWQEGGLGDS